jgi:Asp-tRNA(Asn)/Glu-tRNA(Gln) amidotransferase A subunit family amidase
VRLGLFRQTRTIRLSRFRADWARVTAPIGLMLTGKHWQESTLYRAADAFERAGDWQKIGTKGTSRRKK